MDPIANPFAPGAGTPPPELAGREELLETVRVALARIRLGRPSKSILMVGLFHTEGRASPNASRRELRVG